MSKSFANRFEYWFRTLLPMPFTIAIILTVITFVAAFFFAPFQSDNRAIELLTMWEKGMWDKGLLVFAVQMMLILVLGHVLALSPIIDRWIKSALQFCTDTARSVAIVSFLTVLTGYFNWGLALVFGAIFARKVAEKAMREGVKLNYPLVGAAGYVGLLVWHGGLSGSSLIKVAEQGHLREMARTISPEKAALVPDLISFEQTVFSPMNLFVFAAVLIAIPSVLYIIGRKVSPSPITLQSHPEESQSQDLIGMERLDHSPIASRLVGAIILGFSLYKLIVFNRPDPLAFFTPNNINFTLLGLGILAHKSFHHFMVAVDQAIGGVSGILIQFPLYFGIMGIMQSSGMVEWISSFFVHISNSTTYPIFTFISAGIINIFVPSGGGQWAVQGPIIIQAASELDVSLSKCILAMAYGDQVTNMLQPFWALPLLGITGLKAREILPYTSLLFLLASIIFVAALLIF